MDEPSAPIRSWSWWWIIASSVLIGFSYIAAQVAGLIGVGVFDALTTPGFDPERWGAGAVSNGLVLSVATFASAIVCIPMARWLAGRRESAPWAFLGFRPVRWRDIGLACGAIGILIAISDPLNVWLGRPLVPPFMLQAYWTAGSPLVLFLAVAIVGPLTEEVVFRGFLFGALRARAVPIGLIVGLTSVLFAVIHTQYDLWDMTVVLLMGLLFAVARARFDSVIPSIAMHGFANTVAFIETVLIARA